MAAWFSPCSPTGPRPMPPPHPGQTLGSPWLSPRWTPIALALPPSRQSLTDPPNFPGPVSQQVRILCLLFQWKPLHPQSIERLRNWQAKNGSEGDLGKKARINNPPQSGNLFSFVSEPLTCSWDPSWAS